MQKFTSISSLFCSSSFGINDLSEMYPVEIRHVPRRIDRNGIESTINLLRNEPGREWVIFLERTDSAGSSNVAKILKRERERERAESNIHQFSREPKILATWPSCRSHPWKISPTGGIKLPLLSVATGNGIPRRPFISSVAQKQPTPVTHQLFLSLSLSLS